MIKLSEQNIFIRESRLARLATVDELSKPLVLPVCYVFVNGNIYTPIDKKPKTVRPEKMKRIRNIMANPNVSLVIDRWSEDWTKLAYVSIAGRAEIISEGAQYLSALEELEQKYDQYKKMDLKNQGLPVIKITPEKFVAWGNFKGQ